MTRKHFIAIAEALHSCKPCPIEERRNWIDIVDRLTEVCARQNPNFSRSTFKKACGMLPEDSEVSVERTA
jgi:hypothetical protein